MKLIGTHPSPFTRKVRIVLAEKKLDCDFVVESPYGVDTKVPAHNPLGKIPVLVVDDGTTLYDSRVIAGFLDNVSPISRLIPQDNRERIEVRRWEALADGVLDAGLLVRAETAQREENERSTAWVARQMGKVRAGIDAMEPALGDKPFCTGNSYTLADIAVGTCLGWLDFRFPEIGWREDHPNLARLIAKLNERPSFLETAPRE
jgi:glutathione S-transferase